MNNFDCIVALLLDFGADVNNQNVGGNTPLHVAATRNSKESAKWLLRRGADVTALNKNGKTPYDLGITANCVEVSDIIQSFSLENMSMLFSKLVPPPPRLIVEFTDIDNVVQNVLSSLSSSIGKEYTPDGYYSKNSQLSSHSSRQPSEIAQTDSIKPALSDETKSIIDTKSESRSSSIVNGPKGIIRSTPSSKDTSNISSEALKPPLTKENEKLDNLEERSAPRTNSDETFKIAWNKTQKAIPAPSILKLKNYLIEKSDPKSVKDVVEDLYKLELGFLNAVAELEKVKSENQMLQSKLAYQT
jgi:hypothetical protein